ncbi:hypothetical protein [Nocardia puris]|uniref:hypothetical protein n=1 Tax=Nocardia puris TaxID=208602 RepID=UPI0011BED23F|nr:hypothetical protein [Nocardia puris]
MRHCTGVVESITVFLGAVIGGLALATPITLAWARGATTLEMELAAHSLPRATAIGCVVAVVVAVFVSTADSPMVAWLIALAAMTALLVNHLLGRGFAAIAPLSTLNYIDSMAGGALLGGLLAAVPLPSFSAAAGALGALTSIVLGDMSGARYERPARPSAWFVAEPLSLWLLGPATLLVVVCALRNRRPRLPRVIAVELPLRPIVAVLAVMTVTLGGSEWLARHGSSPSAVALVAVGTVAVAAVAALLLPDRDGVLVLLATAVAAAGGAIVLTPLSMWTVPLLFGATVGGMVLGTQWPHPMVALGVLGALGLFGALTAVPRETPVAAAGTAGMALAVVTGYCFTSAVSGYSPSLVLAIGTLFVPGVVVAVRARVFGGPLDAPPRDSDPGLLLRAAPGLTAVFVTVGCAFAITLLYRLREPESARSEGPAQSGGAAPAPG